MDDPLDLAELTHSPPPDTRCPRPYNIPSYEYWAFNLIALLLIGTAILLNQSLLLRGIFFLAGLSALFYVQWWKHLRRMRYRFNRQFTATLDCFIHTLIKDGTPIKAYKRLADTAPWPTNRIFNAVWREVAVSGFSEPALNRANLCLRSQPLTLFTAVMTQHFDEGGDLPPKLAAIQTQLPPYCKADYWFITTR